MKILVTGGAGFIGYNLTQMLLDEDHKVTVLDNFKSGTNTVDHTNVNYIKDDCRWINGLWPDGNNFDIIYHLAALPRIQFSIKNPDLVYEANSTGTLEVAQFARAHNIPIVYAGTSSVHSGVTENPYTLTKYFGERILEMYSQLYNVNVCTTRFYNVYGNPIVYEGPYGLVMTIFTKQWLNQQPLTITGDGEQRRDFTHVKDICDGFVKAGTKMVEGSLTGYNTFELGTGKNYSINELANMFDPNNKKYVPARKGEARLTLANNKEAKNVLGWNPKDRLKTFVESFKRRNSN